MKEHIAILILGLALSGAATVTAAQERSAAAAETAAPASAPAPEPPAPEAVDEAESGAAVRIRVDTDDAKDVGAVGRALATGLAAILEEHVLTRDDLSEEDREEVREAIAELRGEIQREAREAGREIRAELRGEVQNELHGASREIAAAMKEKTRPRVIIDGDGDDGEDVPWWVGIVASLAIVFTLGLPIIIVALILYFAYRRRRLAHETINRYLASGKDVPPEVMQNLFKDAGTAASTPKSNLHKGTVNTGLGLGIIICFYAVGIEFLAAIGFIFLFVGLAQLLIWKLEQGKKGEGEQPQE
jgi:hypothetical protein